MASDHPGAGVVRLAERLRKLREGAPILLTQSELGQALGGNEARSAGGHLIVGKPSQRPDHPSPEARRLRPAFLHAPFFRNGRSS